MAEKSGIKPITGSWFSIYWYDRRHYYWNDACLRYTDGQWDAVIKDMADLGLEYLVLCDVASHGKSVYDSKVLPKIETASRDPLEAVMTACDRYGMKVFLTNDYFNDKLYFKTWEMFEPENVKTRYQILREVAEKYSGHPSFYGWYWAWEPFINPYFPDYFMRYVNETTREAKRLTPAAKILVAPYGTKTAVADATFVKQLENLEVDFVAYQDCVGCRVMNTEQSRRAFETLRKVHDKVPQRRLWADVETFTWEGIPNLAATPLIPAKMDRLEKQLAAVSPYVDRILVFIFEGLFSRPESPAYTGYAPAGRYYREYVDWLTRNHPEMIRPRDRKAE